MMNPFSVFLDAGHGGKESPGATFRGIRECDVTLDVALRVKRIVAECTSENPNLILSLTRDRDKFVGLNERAEIANVAGADYFLSLHCCPKDTAVTMADGTVEKIQDVAVGDYVMDSTGMPSRVKKVFKRSVSEKIKCFSVYKSTRELLLTNEHPVLINSGKSIRYVKAKDVLIGHQLCIPILGFNSPLRRLDVLSCFESPYYYDIEDNTIRAKRSLFIKKATTKPFARFLDLNEDFLWMLGLFAADGACEIKHYSSVRFGLNASKDTWKIEKLVRILAELGLNPKVRIERGCSQVCVVSNILANIVKHLVPGDCYTKKLNQILMFLSPSKQRHILDGWIDGDGCYYKDTFKADSVSINLASQMFHLAMRCGLHPSIARQKATSGYGTKVEFNNRITFSANDKNWLPPKGNVFFSERPSQICPNIRKISDVDYSGDVFNLETETGSYVANNFAVHNCNADQDDDTDPSKEAKGEEVWYAKGSKMGLACALVLVDFIDEIFPTKCRGAKAGDFTVLTATHMPANLVEMGFIDAVSENEGFRDPLQLEKIANTIAMGLFYIQGAWEKLKVNTGG